MTPTLDKQSWANRVEASENAIDVTWQETRPVTQHRTNFRPVENSCVQVLHSVDIEQPQSDFSMTLKTICFTSQQMKRSKHGLFVFPPKKTLIWRRHCSIGQSCCSMTSKRSIDFQKVLGKPRATRVCIRSINQSNRSISVRLLFLFRSRVFISRSYENRSNGGTIQTPSRSKFRVNRAKILNGSV